MTHIEALELDRVPKHLLVLGGGYVGLEMAQALRRFGSRVTVIERNDALAHREDRDVSEALRELFDDEGIEVLTATPVERVEGRSGESVRLHATHGMIEGSDLDWGRPNSRVTSRHFAADRATFDISPFGSDC